MKLNQLCTYICNEIIEVECFCMHGNGSISNFMPITMLRIFAQNSSYAIELIKQFAIAKTTNKYQIECNTRIIQICARIYF